MLEELLSMETYKMSLKDAVLRVLEGWEAFADVKVRLELTVQNTSPLAYETDNNSIYVHSMSCHNYACSERDSPDPLIAASYCSILNEARSVCPKDSVSEPFHSDWRLFVAFSILHEIGHCDTRMYNPQYDQLEKRQKEATNHLPNKTMLRASAYRQLPLERSADAFAKERIKQLIVPMAKADDVKS